MDSGGFGAGGFICGLACCFCVYLGLFGWAQIAPTEMALKYNFFFQTVDPTVLKTAGFTYIGPWTRLLKYPKTQIAVHYSGFSALAGRTRDGLPVTLEVTFQYQLDENKLYELYKTLEIKHNTYEDVFKTIGAHQITEIATLSDAYEYFGSVENISSKMTDQMRSYYRANLFSNIVNVQIVGNDLPEKFMESVQTAQNKKTNITGMHAVKEQQRVQFATNLKNAHTKAEVIHNKALGDCSIINNAALSDAKTIEYFVQVEREAYFGIKTNLSMSSEELIDYIWYDCLQGGGVAEASKSGQDMQILVGVNPETFIDNPR